MDAPETPNGKKISLQEARNYVQNYQNISWPFSFMKTNSMLIKRRCVEDILSQNNCSYIRFYIAKTTDDDTGQLTLVLVGADEEKINIIREGEDARIYQELGICPPECFGEEL